MSEIVSIIGLVIAILGLTIAILSILFVMWDHIQEHRNLTKQVQKFYESFEKLIYSCYSLDKTKKQWEEKTSGWSKEMKSNNPLTKKYKEIFFKFATENHFLNDRINYNFNHLSQYLGLSRYRNQQFYLNHKGNLLSNKGAIFEFFINLEHNYELNRRPINYDNEAKLNYVNDDLIQEISKYLRNMREFWERNHKNIFRSKIKPKKNFNELI